MILDVPTSLGYYPSMSILSAPHFHDETAAIKYVEARVWADGKPVCPKCGEIDNAGQLKGKSTRPGVWKCYSCRKPFTVKVGTIFEDSHVKMHLWLQAIILIAGSKKGISSNQLHRVLGVTLKTAWFMSHRIRLAMSGNDGSLFGEDGGAVEVDETYIGKVPGKQVKRGPGHKEMVLSLVDRKKGVRSFHIAEGKFDSIKAALAGNVSPNAALMTDEARMYVNIGKQFASHNTVHHASGEYAREGGITTNTVEGFFSVFKRGMKGTYQHCSSDHLHRYLAEFDFRYNNRVALGVNDGQRADNLLAGVVGKRLTYKTAG
jgi:transposase-like protein